MIQTQACGAPAGYEGEDYQARATLGVSIWGQACWQAVRDWILPGSALGLWRASAVFRSALCVTGGVGGRLVPLFAAPDDRPGDEQDRQAAEDDRDNRPRGNRATAITRLTGLMICKAFSVLLEATCRYCCR